MTTDTSFAAFAVDQIAAFREQALRNDASFFQWQENIAVFRDFAQALPFIWQGMQNKSEQYLAASHSANKQAL